MHQSDNAIKNRWHLINRYKVSAKQMKKLQSDEKFPKQGISNLSCETSFSRIDDKLTEVVSTPNVSLSPSTHLSSEHSDKKTLSTCESMLKEDNYYLDSKFSKTQNETTEWLIQRPSFSPLKEFSLSHHSHFEHDHGNSANSSPMHQTSRCVSNKQPSTDAKPVDVNNNKRLHFKLRMLKSPEMKNIHGRKRTCALRIFSPKRKNPNGKSRNQLVMSATTSTTVWSIQSTSGSGDSEYDEDKDNLQSDTEDSPDNQWIDDFLSSDSVEISTRTSTSANMMSPFSTTIRSFSKAADGVCPDHLCPSPFPPISQPVMINRSKSCGSKNDINKTRRRMEAMALARLSAPISTSVSADHGRKGIIEKDGTVAEDLDDVELPFALSSPPSSLGKGFELLASPASLFKITPVGFDRNGGNECQKEEVNNNDNEFSLPFTSSSSVSSMTGEMKPCPLLLKKFTTNKNIANKNNNDIMTTSFNANRSIDFKVPATAAADFEEPLLSIPHLHPHRPPLHPLPLHLLQLPSLNNSQRSVQKIEFICKSVH